MCFLQTNIGEVNVKGTWVPFVFVAINCRIETYSVGCQALNTRWKVPVRSGGKFCFDKSEAIALRCNTDDTF